MTPIALLLTAAALGEPMAIVTLAEGEGACADLGVHADDLRRMLRRYGHDVATEQATVAKLYSGTLVPDGGAQRKRALDLFGAAKAAYGLVEFETAVTKAQEALKTLLVVPEPQASDIETRREMRLFLASLLVATKRTADAEELFHRMLVDEPELLLDPARTTDEVRDVFRRAQSSRGQLSLGDLTVSSRPDGARVLVNGRFIGVTPLDLRKQIPYGTYQLQLRSDDLRSFTRIVEVGPGMATVSADLAIEGTLVRQTCLRSPAARTEFLARVGALLEVETLLFVTLEETDAGRFLTGGAVNVDRGAEVRQGRVMHRAGPVPTEALTALGLFLATGRSEPPLPEAVELWEADAPVDGSSEQAAALVVVREDPAVTGETPSAATPWYERWWVWTAAGAAVAATAAGVALAMTLDGAGAAAGTPAGFPAP